MSSRPWTRPDPAAQPLVGSNPNDARKKPPVGTCHTCGRAVTGERRLCGTCAARRDRNRKRRYVKAEGEGA